MFLILAVMLLIIGFRLLIPSQTKKMIIVSMDEIRLWEDPQKETVIPMDQIASTTWDWVWGWIYLKSKDGTEIDKISVRFLRTNKLARKVAEAINEYRQKEAQ